MKIIGLGHYSRTGKDTLANLLLQSPRLAGRRCRSVPFAWKLKQICYDLYQWDGLQPPEFYETPAGEALREVPLPTLGMTPVEIWVAMGTPAVRQNVYERTWIDYLIKGTHDLDVLIIPDVRFPNEFQAIRDSGGVLVKLLRPGVGPRDTVADLALRDCAAWDYVINNGGTLQNLADRGEDLLRLALKGPKQ